MTLLEFLFFDRGANDRQPVHPVVGDPVRQDNDRNHTDIGKSCPLPLVYFNREFPCMCVCTYIYIDL